MARSARSLFRRILDSASVGGFHDTASNQLHPREQGRVKVIEKIKEVSRSQGEREDDAAA